MKNQNQIELLKKEVWLKCFENNNIELRRSYFEKISNEVKNQTGYYIHADTIRNFYTGRNKPSQNTLDVLSSFVLDASSDSPKYFNDFKNINVSKPVKKKADNKWRILAVITIFISLSWFLWQNQITKSSESPTEKVQETIANSVVVLPFILGSKDDDLDQIGFSLYDEIITQVTKINGLNIIARGSADRYQNSDKPIEEIASELNVVYVLNGVVHRLEDDRIRINVELIEADKKKIVWSESYIKTMDMAKLFPVQTAIAKEICSNVQLDLCSADTLSMPFTKNAEAYKFYSKARQYLDHQNPDSILVAMDLFQSAIDLDENFVNAYAEKAIACFHLIGYKDYTREKVINIMTNLVDKAFSVSGKEEYSYFSRAYLNLAQFNISEAFQDFEIALKFRPNDFQIHGTYGMFLRNYGDDIDKALYHVKKAYNLNPWNPVIQVLYGYTLEAIGEFDESHEIFKKAVEKHPEYPRSHITLADHNQNVTGEFDKALFHVYNGLALNANNPQYARSRADIFLDLGLPDSASQVLQSLEGIIIPRYIAVEEIELQLFYQNPERALSIFHEKNVGYRFVYIKLLLMNGKIEETLTFMQENYTDLEHPDEGEKITLDNYIYLTYYGYCLLVSGHTEKAQNLLDSILKFLETRPRHGRAQSGFHYLDVHIYAMLGKEEQAIKTLKEAFDSGMRTNWWEIRNYPFYSNLKDNPEFNKLFDNLQKDILEMQKNVR